MKISQLIDQLYWIAKFGRPIRKISSEELFSSPELIEHPVFFLSTGRCGTEWFTHTIKKAKNVSVFHNPTPNLSVQNKFVHDLIQKGTDQPLVDEVATQLLFAAREQYFRFSYKTNKRYIETNNHITFFAHTLAKLFPTATFVHLYRHPGEFVTSGINRGWFDQNNSATEKMITADSEEWGNYSQIEKIGWVWKETNNFVEAFKKSHPNRVFAYDFSKRDPGELTELFQFLNITLSDSFIKKSLRKRRNVQKEQRFPSYKDWKEADKEALKTICGDLSEKYHYTL